MWSVHLIFSPITLTISQVENGGLLQNLRFVLIPARSRGRKAQLKLKQKNIVQMAKAWAWEEMPDVISVNFGIISVILMYYYV